MNLSRTSQLACAASAPLVQGLGQVAPDQVGMVLGSGWGSLPSIVEFEWENCTLPVRQVNPLLFAETVSNAPAGQVAIQFGWSAFNLTVSSGSASGLAAVAEASDLLAASRARVVVAGGADAINSEALRILRADGTASADPGSLPFARSRSGLIGGEGACLVALESAEGARARGAPALARLRASRLAYAPATDLTDEHPEEGEGLLRDLLDSAGLEAREIQLVVASACGSPGRDRAEARMIGAVFGDAPEPPMVLAPKGVLGETWGASGPLAIAAALESIRLRRVPGRPRGFVPDPALPPLDIPCEPRAARVRNAVVIAWSGTGHLAALLLSEPDDRDAS
jgi:3-oxoacyl-(acyl-carrier-protein) synthase